jgi:4-hydroxybenzoate polyprenyltransferase
MKQAAIFKYAALVGVLAGISAIAMGFYIHSAQPKLGPSWHVAGILVTSPRLLLGLGIVMVIGGVLTLWSPALGGLLVLASAVLGLVYCYTHEWTRIPLLKIWALPVVLGWIAGILAGYALAKSVEAYDGPADDEIPAAPASPPPTAAG